MKTFKTWLLEQLEPNWLGNLRYDDIVRDFAQDVKDNGSFPASNSYRTCYVHLVNNGAHIDCVRAFRQAWLEWQDEQLTIREMSWGIPFPKWKISTLQDAYASRSNSILPGEPEANYSQLQKEYREGFYNGVEKTRIFLTSGGLVRQLEQWCVSLFKWIYKPMIEDRLTPPDPPQIWKETRQAILARDKKTCVYCRRPANCVDHVLPLKLGGTDDYSNLAAACKKCNSTKHARHPLDWEPSRRYIESV